MAVTGKSTDCALPRNPTPSLTRKSSTGFARRLSKRVKHLPGHTEEPPLKFQDKKTSPPLPPDSAYSSGGEKKTPPPYAPKEEEEKRRESVLAPLPTEIKTMDPPSRVSKDQQSRMFGGLAPSSKSMASSYGSRSLSIRNIFRRRRWGEKELAAS